MKNIKENLKNRSKEIVSKIMNGFLFCKFITSCLYKPRKIVDYHQNIAQASYSIRKLNRSNAVYLNYRIKDKTRYGL